MRSRTRAAWLAVALAAALLLPAPAAPAVASDHGAADSTLGVHVESGPGGLEVQGRCIVHAPPAVVWEVLTDYDGIDRFVSSMRESRVAERADHHLLVEQVAVSRLFLFTRRFRATL